VARATPERITINVRLSTPEIARRVAGHDDMVGG